jgi:FixJ family two-component response regulator
MECVVLDIQMAGLSGLEVQERLTRSGKTIPVIFITAHDDIGIREQGLGAGAVAFLRKPFNDEVLITTLRAAVARGAGREGR